MDDIIEEILKEIEHPSVTLSDSEMKKYLYREMVRLTLIIDEQISEAQIIGKMSALVRKAKKVVNGENEAQRVEQLLHWFYHELRFSCHYAEYFNTESLLIHKVIETKRGMPISLAAILLYLAASLNLPIYPVNFPPQLILRAEITTPNGRKETRFINPWNGEFLTLAYLEKWLMGEVAMPATITPELIRRAEPLELLERLETLFKMALTKEKKYAEVLKMIEFRLIFSPEDPYEIRDRGMILASMDCYQAALEDLSYFIDQCPDDPSAVLLKSEIAGLEKQVAHTIIH